MICSVTFQSALAQVTLGTEIKIPSLEGDQRLKIPEGTQTGTVFRMRGRGVINVNGLGRGDQLVTVKVVTPTKLTQKQREIFEDLSQELAPPIPSEESEGFFERVKDIFG